jgi:hypothetical protein
MKDLKELIDKINLPTLLEAQQEICKFVNNLDISIEQKEQLNRSIVQLEQKLKDLAND